MHVLTQVVSYSKVRSSSEEVHTLARRQTAVSSAVQLWESKMMQSKAMEDFRKNNINSSNFVLQLPASYSQTDQEVTGSAVLTKQTYLIIKSIITAWDKQYRWWMIALLKVTEMAHSFNFCVTCSALIFARSLSRDPRKSEYPQFANAQGKRILGLILFLVAWMFQFQIFFFLM